jgi:hypothetical protein
MSYTLVNSLNKKKECTCSDCSKYIGDYTIRARLKNYICGHHYRLEFFNNVEKEWVIVISDAPNCCSETTKDRPDFIDNPVYCAWDGSELAKNNPDDPGEKDDGDEPMCDHCGDELPCKDIPPAKACCGSDIPECEECGECQPTEEEIPVCTDIIICRCYDTNGTYVTDCGDGGGGEAESCKGPNGEVVPCLNCKDKNNQEVFPKKQTIGKYEVWVCPCFNAFNEELPCKHACWCKESGNNYDDYSFKITQDYFDSDCRVKYRLLFPQGKDRKSSEPSSCEIGADWQYVIVWQLINSSNEIASWIYTDTLSGINYPETYSITTTDENGLEVEEWPTIPFNVKPLRYDFVGSPQCCGSDTAQCRDG